MFSIGVPREPAVKNEFVDRIYDIAGEIKNSKKGKSLGHRFQRSLNLTVDENPAPGSYDQNLPTSKKRIVSMYAKRQYLEDYVDPWSPSTPSCCLVQAPIKQTDSRVYLIHR